MALACSALRSQRSSDSRATNWAATKRILDASCIDCLRMNRRPVAASGRKVMTASAPSAPFFVPPKERTSTPAAAPNAPMSTPRKAAALASRAPSRWSSISRAVGPVGERGDLVDCVAGPDLCGLGDRDDPGLHVMLVTRAAGGRCRQLGAELAVRGVHRQQLRTEEPLRGAALVHVDVGTGRADHRFVRAEQRLQPHDVGPGAVEREVDLGLRSEVAGGRARARPASLHRHRMRGSGPRSPARWQQARRGGRLPSCRWRRRGGNVAACSWRVLPSRGPMACSGDGAVDRRRHPSASCGPPRSR